VSQEERRFATDCKQQRGTALRAQYYHGQGLGKERFAGIYMLQTTAQLPNAVRLASPVHL
jgi:hypothetical protein